LAALEIRRRVLKNPIRWVFKGGRPCIGRIKEAEKEKWVERKAFCRGRSRFSLRI
jgi:hypothetical protein